MKSITTLLLAAYLSLSGCASPLLNQNSSVEGQWFVDLRTEVDECSQPGMKVLQGWTIFEVVVGPSEQISVLFNGSEITGLSLVEENTVRGKPAEVEGFPLDIMLVSEQDSTGYARLHPDSYIFIPRPCTILYKVTNSFRRQGRSPDQGTKTTTDAQ